jgi:hypothetical protein
VATDPLNRAFSACIPDDLLDPPQFGGILELVKDTLVLELRNFFRDSNINSARRTELPEIQKYSISNDALDPFSTSVTIVQKYPEILEHLPHIAVLASNSTERKLSFSVPVIAIVQNPSSVVSAAFEPFALTDGDQLVIRTTPAPRKPVYETITFTADRFPTGNPIGSALAADVAKVINEQAQFFNAVVISSGGHNYVSIQAGGTQGNLSGKTPTSIEVSPSSIHADTVLGLSRRGTSTSLTVSYPTTSLVSAAATFSALDVGNYITISNADAAYFNNGRFQITAVSSDGSTATYDNRYGQVESTGHATWYIGQRDTHLNPAHPPKNRYAMAQDAMVSIEILATDENTRGELTDLTMSFFGFFAESKFFTFQGRSWFPNSPTDTEYWIITPESPITIVGENEIVIQNDGTGKVYTNSLSFKVDTTYYLDRELMYPGTNTPFVITGSSVVQDDTLPVPGEVD